MTQQRDPVPAPAALAPAPAATTRPEEPAPGRHRRRSYRDRLTAPLPGVRAVTRLAREAGALRPGTEARRDVPLLPCAPAPLPPAGPGVLALTWAGHASWILRIGGLTVLTDPVWSHRILGTPPRVTPVGVPWASLPPVDAVVISHNHYDHLDAPTLRRLPRTTPVLVPAGLGRWFRRRRFTRVHELDWWQGREIGGVTFDFVPAHHWSRRGLLDTCRTLWGGWVLTDPQGRKVHFAGDTGYGHWFTEIGRRHPGIDLTLMPIGAYAPAGGCGTSTATRRRPSPPAPTSAPAGWPPCTGRPSCSPPNPSSNLSPGSAPPGPAPAAPARTCGTCPSAAPAPCDRGRPQCEDEAVRPRSRRHTPGAALISTVSATAAATPSQGSAKSDPPTMPMSW